MDLYGRALAQDPQGPYALDAQLGRAGLLAESGDVAAALQAYEAVLRQYPEDPRAPRTRLEIQRLRRLAPARRDE
jgi:tetratricopeptide (TPR) repeat protein